MGWKETIGLSKRAGVSHSFKQGEKVTTLTFYPATMDLILELRVMAKPLSALLASVFESRDNDTGSIQRHIPQADGGESAIEMISRPIEPELAKARFDQRQQAIQGFIDSVSSKESQAVVGRLLMDSLRDVFQDEEKKPSPEEFFGKLDAETLVGFFTGVAKANKGMFGPLGDRVVEALKATAQKTAEGLKLTEAEVPQET